MLIFRRTILFMNKKPGPKPGYKGARKIRALFSLSEAAHAKLKHLAKSEQKSASAWIEEKILQSA